MEQLNNKKLKYIITLQTKNVLAENQKSFLYQLNETKQIWLPFITVKPNKLMFWKFNVLAYENDEYTYTLVDTKVNKDFKISLLKLAENILAKPEGFNVEIKKYEPKSTAKKSNDEAELVEW